MRAAAIAALCTLALACDRSDRSGGAGHQSFPVASGELPVASSDRPQQLAPPWSASPEPSSPPSAASATHADAAVAEDKGPVRLGTITVTGGLSREVIGKTIRGQMPKLRQCHDKALAGSPGLKGQLDVRLVIDREGAVTTAVNGGSDLGNEELIGCVLRAFWAMKFPAPKDGIVLAVVPLKFGVQQVR